MFYLFYALAISYFVLLVNAEQVEYAPIVQLNDGQMRGLVQDAQNGHKVHLYQGIRYGRAQRFEKPKPVEPWTELYNATTYRDACVQFGAAGRQTWLLDYTKTESEDCLFLNVWSPQTEKKEFRPVMVWIHGGAFESGTSFTPLFDGRYLADQGHVVVVSINYRLGPFGFLYSRTENAPGNVGLHDQILALKWVQQNICYFGGDPHSVTIFGESAGSMSVGALILSPLAKGLFKRAIMQSGAPNTFSFIDSTSNALAKTRMIAHKLNCPTVKTEDTIKCLKSKTFEQVVNATVGDFARNELFALVYGDEALPIEPVQALKNGKFNRDIDLLYGVTANEGTVFIFNILPQIMSNEFNLTLSSLKQDIVNTMNNYSSKVYWSEVADYYISKLPHQPSQDDLKSTLTAVFGDNLVCSAIFFAEQLSIHSPSTNYYSYRLTQRLDIVPLPTWMGVPHGTDMYYLFAIPLFKHDKEATRLSTDMIRAWTNFAKSGHPGKVESVQWTPALNHSTIDHTPEHFNLDTGNYKIVKNFYSELCNSFWKPKIFV